MTQTTRTARSFIDYTRRASSFYFALFFLAVTVGFGLLGKYCWSQRTELLRNGTRVTGIVKDYETSHDETLTFAPVVEYLPLGHTKPVTIVSKISQSHRPYRIGQKVAVSYLPHNPSRADLVDAANNPLGELVCLGFIVVFGGGGIFAGVTFVQNFQKQKAQQATA